MRLDRFVSMGAAIPRREASAWIRAGRVTVQGQILRDAKHQVATSGEVVTVDGDTLRTPGHRTLMMHKPPGCISATRSRCHETVLDHVPATLYHTKLAPVGRLDKDTTGLLLLTTDGGLSHRITHPRRKVAKVYLATLKARPLDPDAVSRFSAGLTLADGTACRSAVLEVIDASHVRVVLTEGRFHQVKRMLGHVGGHVIALEREKIGPLALDPSLPVGGVRELTDEELANLIAALTPDDAPADGTPRDETPPHETQPHETQPHETQLHSMDP